MAGHSKGSWVRSNREWRHLVGDGSQHCRGSVESWGERHSVLLGCHSLADVLLRVRENPDTGLAALLTLVRGGDQLAGRVILQSLIGRLVRMARRDVRAGVDDYLAALWCAIRTYPLERRPRQIAANLALDSLKAVHREHRWTVRGEVSTWPPGDVFEGLVETAHAIHAVPDLPEVTDLLDVAQRSAVIDDLARRVLVSVYVDGLTSRQAAERHQTSPGAIRIRCNRAVQRLRSSATSWPSQHDVAATEKRDTPNWANL